MTTQITTFVTPYTTTPSRQSPATFSADRDTRLQEEATRIPQQNSMATEMNAVAVEVNTNAVTATAQAESATASAASALAAANYKGAWSGLTGAANVPYAVSHNGYYWQLTSNLADVTAKEPGVDAEWLLIPATIRWVAISAATDAVNNTGYMVDTSGGAVTLTLPASPSAGDRVSYLDAAGTFRANNLTIGRNSEKIMGVAEDLTCSTQYESGELIYTDATNGWRLI